MRKLILFCLLCIPVFMGTSCSKDDNTDSPNLGDTTIVLDVHNDLANWRYYSFENIAEVSVSDYSDTLGWDLGIHYESFRTNGGQSGIGQGAVLDLGAVGFDTVTINTISGLQFTPDNSISVVTSTSMPPVMEDVPGCELTESMFLSPQGPPPHTYTPNNHVYIIRTANGRHVKFIGLSFFNDLGDEGYLQFKFAFLD
jgi:hypothetical protein